MWNLPFLPQDASTVAGRVDLLFLTLIGLALLFAVPVAALVIYFAVKYRRGTPASRAGALHQNMALEVTWIVIPLGLALGIFFWGARLYVDLYRLPADGLDIYVVGKQWMWKFQHPTGQREINELHVPAGRPIRLTMISEDVIHSFYVPAFRVKRDVLPGNYTTAWFEATEPGSYDLFCAEFCGTEHSRMVGRVIVMEPRQYAEWLTRQPITGAAPIPEASGQAAGGGQPATLAEAGAQLFQSLGCSSCHLADGSGPAPSLVGLYGREVTLADGQTVTADTQYLRESILNPNAQVVAGYNPIMPTFAGQVSEEQLAALLEYIKSLGGSPAENGGQSPGSN